LRLAVRTFREPLGVRGSETASDAKRRLKGS